jgi:EAL and modified HD-GYP domain-containing signal transduction protein
VKGIPLKYSYIARQPILNRSKQTVGFELLFRDGPDNKFPDIDADLATSRLLSDHFLSIHNDNAKDKLTFVNFPYQSLINLVPTLLPAKNLVVELLEDCPPTTALLNAVKEMARQGYSIALDDFVPSNAWKPFLPFIAYIKFDIRIVPIAKAKLFVARLKGTKIQFLAEKVETEAEFQEAYAAGFTLFQGYFFSRPEIMKKKKIDPAFLTVIQLCKEVSKNNVDFESVEALISRDVSLSLKLLTLVNSTSILSSKIQSFKQAIIYLGEEKLRKFVSLLAITSTAEDKPKYLFNLSIQTARFCELVAEKSNIEFDSGTAFLTGMFSYLDSLLDQPLTEIIESIPIENSVKDALIKQEGGLGGILKLAKAYEQAQWDDVVMCAKNLGLSDEQVVSCYNDAIHWTSELFASAP